MDQVDAPFHALAQANEKKDWRIYQDFAVALVKEATALYRNENLRIGLEDMIYAFDSRQRFWRSFG